MKTQAIACLRKALREGFHDTRQLRGNQQFATLRGDPAFEQILASPHGM